MNRLFDINNEEEVKEFIANTESGLYTAINEDGENVIIKLDQGKGMDYETLQANGWIRVSEYSKDGEYLGESYKR